MSVPLPFTPVPVRARRDGWTPETQARFVAGLAQTRNVAAACRAVGRSWQSAYRLRARADAAGFAAAWDAALARPELPDAFTGRAVGGSVEPISWRGRRVGERRRFDDRLARYILRVRLPERYGVVRDGGRSDAPDRASDLADALGALRRDLSGPGPHGGAEFAGDVARTSSPSAQRARPQPRCARDAPARPAAPAPSDPRLRGGRLTRSVRATRPPLDRATDPPPDPSPDPPPDGQSRSGR